MTYAEFRAKYASLNYATMRSFQLVQLDWMDSVTPSNSWTFLEDLSEPRVYVCHTTGYIIDLQPDLIRLAQSYITETKNPQVMGVLTIPAVSVLDIHVLMHDEDAPTE